MRRKRTLFLFFVGGLMLLTGAALWLLTPQPVDAQCGSQASSCKNCHEVQAKAPVNNDGKPWHQSHAFGDFCVLCHAGNQQATEKIAAHVGMVPPLSDVKAACQQCHASDLTARAQVYATILKVTPGVGGGTTSQAAPTSAATQSAAPATLQATVPAVSGGSANGSGQADVQPTVKAPSGNQLVVDDPNTVDYVQRYNEIVLGQHPVNGGNIILLAMIGLVAVGGGGFVVYNETKINRASGATKSVEGQYPAEVVDMLPDIARLKPQSRASLRNILKFPKKADKALGAIDALVSDEKTEE